MGRSSGADAYGARTGELSTSTSLPRIDFGGQGLEINDSSQDVLATCTLVLNPNLVFDDSGHECHPDELQA